MTLSFKRLSSYVEKMDWLSIIDRHFGASPRVLCQHRRLPATLSMMMWMIDFLSVTHHQFLCRVIWRAPGTMDMSFLSNLSDKGGGTYDRTLVAWPI